MADSGQSQGTQPPPASGHPLPRRASPDKSITLQNHRARDPTRKVSGLAVGHAPTGSPRRNSSGDSNETAQSDGKKWFNRSNLAPPATLGAGSMDIDPPFFQKETDSSNGELRERDARLSLVPSSYLQGGVIPHLRPAGTQSSSAEDYRSVIDDLTIENKRLKEELRRYRQFGSDMLKKDKLFEIKVHGLPRRKKLELEATLRDFAASLDGSEGTPSQRRKQGRHGKNMYSSVESVSKHASSSSSRSRPVDSAYASMSTGPSSHAANSSGTSLTRPLVNSGRARSTTSKVENYLSDTPDGLLPQHVAMTDKEKKKLVVRRLEQLFTGKITGKMMPGSKLNQILDSQPTSDLTPMGPPKNPEAAREARIQPHDSTQKKKSRDNVSTSNSNGDQTDSGGNGGGSGDGSGSGSGGRTNNNSPPSAPLPEQRPTRPRDLDPDRVQIPSENMDYIRHLGLVAPEFLIRKRIQYRDVSPDADGWVFLNLLCNLAQLHMLNVTPGFIRSAVTEKSTKFQLSPDGDKIRWRGGTDGTKFSSESSGDNSQKSPSTDDTDGSNESGQRKKAKVSVSGLSSKKSKARPHISSSSDSFHYKPLFVHQSSSAETSMEETGSQASFDGAEESNAANTKYSESGSPRRRKRRQDGAIIYYSGAPFCTDLSRDPGDISPTTYDITSSGQDMDSLVSGGPWSGLYRSMSGSSLAIRPLSDESAVVNQALDTDVDNPPDLVMDDEDSLNETETAFPWCDEPWNVHLRPIEPPLEPCGLGGVLPEDHFAVIVTTKRPIAWEKGENKSVRRSKSEDTTDAIIGKLASMGTASPSPSTAPSRPDSPIGIEYLSGRVRRLKPVPLPPPARFFPPFSSDSDSDDDGDEADSSEEGDSRELSSSEALISQRANPHSDNSDIDKEQLSSNDEEDEVGDEIAYENLNKLGNVGVGSDKSDVVMSGSSASAAGRLGLVHPGSSAATAGGAESGYSSSMEDEA